MFKKLVCPLEKCGRASCGNFGQSHSSPCGWGYVGQACSTGAGERVKVLKPISEQEFQLKTSMTLGGLLLGSVAVYLGQFQATAVPGSGDGGVASAGPDVIVGAIPDQQGYGSVASGADRLMAYAVGTTSCNLGTTNLAWQDFPSTLHPFIPMNMFRYRNGRLEHIGMSWGKHGFCALQETLCGSCAPAGAGCPNALGVGCSDPYTAGLNGAQGDLGTRSQVNPTTGLFPTTLNSGMPAAASTVGRRLQVLKSEIDSGAFAPIGVASASVDITADVFTAPTAHGLSTGSPVTGYSSTTFPTGITAGTTYYAIVTSSTQFKLATTAANATAGTAINITAAGTGTHTFSSASAGWSVAPANVNLTNDTFAAAVAHGFTNGQRVTFFSAGAPAGTTSNSIYYAIVVDANTVKLATSQANALANVAINVTSTGTGQNVINGTFFLAEGQYVHQQDAAAENDNNNASWREVVFGAYSATSGGSFALNLNGSTKQQLAAINAWKTFNPAVTLVNVDVAADGRFIVGYSVKDNGNGTWRYEYAIQNLNSDRGAGSFSVPVPAGVNLTNVGFHDVPYHSGDPYAGTDWSASVSGGSITWSTQSYATNVNANALRFATLYNFWFDADTAPDAATLSGAIGLFKPGAAGSPTSAAVALIVPSAAAPETPGDLDGNGNVDAADLSVLLSSWGTASADLNGDGSTDASDLAILLGNWS